MKNSLEGLRLELDAVDDKMMQLLADRIALSAKIGLAKKELSLPITQEKERVGRLDKFVSYASENNLKSSWYVGIYETLHGIAIERQKEC